MVRVGSIEGSRRTERSRARCALVQSAIASPSDWERLARRVMCFFERDAHLHAIFGKCGLYARHALKLADKIGLATQARPPWPQSH
jgi:hypothetical protein